MLTSGSVKSCFSKTEFTIMKDFIKCISINLAWYVNHCFFILPQVEHLGCSVLFMQCLLGFLYFCVRYQKVLQKNRFSRDILFLCYSDSRLTHEVTRKFLIILPVRRNFSDDVQDGTVSCKPSGSLSFRGSLPCCPAEPQLQYTHVKAFCRCCLR